MQTIDDSLFQVSVDENGAKMAHLISVTDNYDYLGEDGTKEGTAIAFPVINHDNDWASKMPWTVVDKGDTRVSLTLIDTPESYKSFPYHFEVMTTYVLEGNQVEIRFFLKNSSHKEMPFSLGFVLPNNWPTEEGINKISLNNGKHGIDVASTDFKLNVEEDHVAAFIDEIKLEAEISKTFALTLTLK